MLFYKRLISLALSVKSGFEFSDYRKVQFNVQFNARRESWGLNFRASENTVRTKNCGNREFLHTHLCC